jgi:hypothetical protein
MAGAPPSHRQISAGGDSDALCRVRVLGLLSSAVIKEVAGGRAT